MVKQSIIAKPEERSDSSKYTGVRKRKWGKFVSEIRLPNSRERIWLGSYDTPEKAARAFDAALFCLRGRSAKFNFPQNPPEIAGGRSLSPPEIQVAAAKFANSETQITHSGPSSLETVPQTSQSDHSTLQMESPSPSVSDATTVQLDSELMIDGSLVDLLMNDGPINVSDYSIFPGFDDFSSDFLAQPPPINTFDYGEENFDGLFNSSQESFLWNF